MTGRSTQAAPSAGAVIAEWLGALRQANVRRFVIGETASAIGSGMAPVALAFAVLATPRGSAATVGYVLAAGSLPLLASLVVGGAVADRIGSRSAMLGSDALRTAAQTSLGIWVLAGHPPLWGFMLLQALVGIGMGVFMPASTALIPALTDERDLQQANALRHLAKSIGRVAGPALAGFVVAAVNPGWAIVADGLSYGVSLIFLLSLRLRVGAPAPRQSFVRELREGWREFYSRRWLWAVVGQSGLLGISAWPAFYVLGAVVAKDTLGGATAWGLILSAMGVGTVVGGTAALRLHLTRPLLLVVAAPAMWILPLIGLAFHTSPVWIALGAFVVGASGAISVALWDTTMQREIPARLLSRVSAYDLSVSFLLLPLGYAIVGPVSSVVGMPVSLVGASGIALASVPVVMLVAPVTRIRAASASS